MKPGEQDIAGSHSDGHGNSHGHSYGHSHRHSHEGKEHEHEHEYHHTHEDHPANGSEHTADSNHSPEHGHDHNLNPEHEFEHEKHSQDVHDHIHDRRITVEQDVISKNNLLAERNRGYFEAKGIKVINLVSSPGSGKTSLLERTIRDLKKEMSIYVIEGDQQTMNDANRIDATGAPVVQINTGEGCHLDADMVNKALKRLEPADNSLLMIENVGNLVCPALFDLGESYRVVIMSVTEGEDKPVKYPYMFRTSDLCIINKTDLLPYVDFNMEKAKGYASQVNPELKILELSVKTGEGIELWYEWINGI
jgi:hydrogenase nickel incorporation protein HypB